METIGMIGAKKTGGWRCYPDCQIKTLVGDCIMPREGIFTKVIEAGWIKLGDDIEVI